MLINVYNKSKIRKNTGNTWIKNEFYSKNKNPM